MARSKKSSAKPTVPLLRRLRSWAARFVLICMTVLLLVLVAHRFFAPPPGHYMKHEAARLGGLAHEWVPFPDIAPVMVRAVVAAEDANFCNHWGFDMTEIRKVIAAGESRGASTLSQQVVKNVYLWHGRSWTRKALEALITPPLEALWPKRRILEVYLNMAEFDEGVFGVEAAARHYFNTSASDLRPAQAARLAALLPAPRDRDAARPSAWLRNRASAILDGAATIARDGRAACFED